VLRHARQSWSTRGTVCPVCCASDSQHLSCAHYVAHSADGDEVEPVDPVESIVSAEAPSALNDPFERVLEAARDGDGRAFGLIYEALNRRVHAFARVRGAADPEGLVNDVFLRVFTGLPSFHGGEAQFNAWVFRIARNKMIDEARKQQRRPVEVAQEPTLAIVPVASDNVEADVAERLATADLMGHLDELTDDQRDVVVLRIVSDLTIDTIAEILGKSPGAVKALQRRAFRMIARKLGSEVVPL